MNLFENMLPCGLLLGDRPYNSARVVCLYLVFAQFCSPTPQDRSVHYVIHILYSGHAVYMGQVRAQGTAASASAGLSSSADTILKYRKYAHMHATLNIRTSPNVSLLFRVARLNSAIMKSFFGLGVLPLPVRLPPSSVPCNA
jgi:hypothetical protein